MPAIHKLRHVCELFGLKDCVTMGKLATLDDILPSSGKSVHRCSCFPGISTVNLPLFKRDHVSQSTHPAEKHN